MRSRWHVLVAGEAGVGKTVLLRRSCEPSPLGPLDDMSALTGGELAESVADGAPPHAGRGARARTGPA